MEQAHPESASTKTKRMSRLAIASFVISILNLLNWFFFPTNVKMPNIFHALIYMVLGVTALALAITALIRIYKSSDIKGTGYTIAGLILASPMILFGISFIIAYILNQ